MPSGGPHYATNRSIWALILIKWKYEISALLYNNVNMLTLPEGYGKIYRPRAKHYTAWGSHYAAWGPETIIIPIYMNHESLSLPSSNSYLQLLSFCGTPNLPRTKTHSGSSSLLASVNSVQYWPLVMYQIMFRMNIRPYVLLKILGDNFLCFYEHLDSGFLLHAVCLF